jgi:hypothetical protein
MKILTSFHPSRIAWLATLPCLVGAVTIAQAQTTSKPPQAQAWIDVATFSGMGMPAGMGGSGGNPMAALGGLFGSGGGAAASNTFGNTQSGSTGRWVDVTLFIRNNPSLNEAQQAVPTGFLSPALQLKTSPQARPAPEREDMSEREFEKPKGKLLLYWGCDSTIRAGQPKVLDMANASSADIVKFFVTRHSTQRGAHVAQGRPMWPNPQDARTLPNAASLVGEHTFSGTGVPAEFKFQLPAAQDLMPSLELKTQDATGATQLSWRAAPTARAHFASAMGSTGKDEMVIWTSSELPDTGFGLMDYQTNDSIDRWLREKVLLPAAATQCTVPKGVLGDGAMLRVIGYGNELNLAYPARPSNLKTPWEPVWAAKIRVKTVANAMLGMPSMSETPAGGNGKPATTPEDKSANPLNLLRGIFGR